MSDLGIGIIGCGNISAAYLRLAPLFKGVEMRAVADMNSASAQARAKEFGVRAETVEGLLAAPDIDIIVNLTIPDAHFAVTKSIVAAGKHAYSEKPLVLSLDEGKELAALAKAKGVQVGCAPDTFLGGAHQQVRQLVDDGAIGKITSGTCHVLSPGMEMWHPNPDFFFLPGGGPILDLGPYYIAALINLIGPIKRVGAITSSAQAERTITSQPRAGEKIPVKTPTTINALMEFHNGANITLSASWDVHAHQHSNIELYGTQGSLFVPDPNFFGGDIKIAGTDREIKPVEGWSHPFSVPNQEDGRANYRASGLADMAMAIHEGRDARCAMARALHGVDAMVSILKSGEIGEFVTLTTTCTRPAALDAAAAAALLR
jgi:predicted dehydrogenase